MKKCPRCASDVPREAAVCRYCRAKLPVWNVNWWQASDEVWYPPHAHPDFGKRPLTPPAPRKRWSTQTRVLVGLAVAAGVGVFALTAVTAEEEDTLGVEACEEFADLRDIDLYTVDELREQVQQVYDDGRYADSANIRYYSRLLVSTVTNNNTVGFAQAVEGMAEACDAL